MTAEQTTPTLLHKLLDAASVAKGLRGDDRLRAAAVDAARANERLHEAIVELQPRAEQLPPF
jgi:hypothetical protein